MTQDQPFRLAVVNSHPIQYFAPLYAYLNRDPDIEITALYCSDFSLRGGVDPGFKQPVKWNVDLLEGYRHVFLGKRARKRKPGGFFSLTCPQVWREIRSGRYDAVWLHGYTYAALVLAFLAARSKGIPVFMRGETQLKLHRSALRLRLRHSVLSRAFRRLGGGCLAVGSANRAYYRNLGIPDSKIFDVPYTVDNQRFIDDARLDADQRREVRAKLGVPQDQPVVLYASKFMARKHPDDVVEAIARLRGEGITATLLFVGTGELETRLRARVAELELADVVFAGFVNQAELPAVYAASDIFVLPSENEPWGLIVNEVMCAGLPVVVGDEVGCVPDLVHEDVNGKRIRAGNVDSLVSALRPLLLDEDARAAMGAQSLAMIRKWSYAECHDGIKAAIASVRPHT